MRGAVGPEGAAAGRSDRTWLLSRALYRCKYLPLGHVPMAERRAVLHNLLLAWAPFDHAEYRVALRGDAALAVAWDGVAVAGMLAEAGAPGTAQFWPETLLREPMASDGMRLLECLEGVDAQVWRGQALCASRWWPQQPDAAEAQVWLRSLGGIASQSETLPPVTPVAWRRRPWLDLQTADDLLSTSSRLERVAVGATLVGLAALTAAQAHQAWAAFEDKQLSVNELARVRLDAAPVLAARQRAESLAQEAASLAAQLTGVLPLEVLQHLSEVLPPRGVTLKELELSGQKLRLAFELTPEVQRSALVKDLQAGGWFTKVSEAREGATRGWILFETELAGQPAPAARVRPPTAAAAAPPVTAAPPVSALPTGVPGAPSATAVSGRR